ncbi:hypothetical protein BQ8794_70432 [Mesorhizobium prunaredense]|uniref:Uncharacterized protein n=1 Tax=Mesorhizobium prunaredense TaxID=1631249 RepID=A0A1R3VKT4_9HYPH|nr:hypothetical protein BQ8794_70432 [Mesorhizobium prunaredense]
MDSALSASFQSTFRPGAAGITIIAVPGNAISGHSHIFVAAWRSPHTCVISPADGAFMQHRPAAIIPENVKNQIIQGA